MSVLHVLLREHIIFIMQCLSMEQNKWCFEKWFDFSFYRDRTTLKRGGFSGSDLIYTVNQISKSDEGSYSCKVQIYSYTYSRTPLYVLSRIQNSRAADFYLQKNQKLQKIEYSRKFYGDHTYYYTHWCRIYPPCVSFETLAHFFTQRTCLL